MNEYKKQLRIRMNIVSLAAVTAALAYAILTIYRDQLPVLPSFIKGFNTGAFVGLELLAIWYLGKCMRARKNTTDMKKMFIEENDERTGLILQYAGMYGISIIFLVLTVATIISGFFSAIIFFTLTITLIFVLIVFYGLWIYFAKII